MNAVDERRVAAWSAAFHFLVLCSYYVVRPLRDAMGLRGNVKSLPWLMVATLATMALVTPLFATLVERLPRRRFVPLVYHAFAVILAAFAVLLARTSAAWAARAFFIWITVFNLFAVSIFWALMADRFGSAAAARRFGIIALGGTLGAMAGAAIATTLTTAVGPARLPLVAAVLLEGANFCFYRILRSGTERDDTGDIPPRHSLASLAGTLVRSPYLGAIAGYMLLYTVTSTFTYLEQARLVQSAVSGDAARIALFARMDLWVNILSVVLQALATRWLLARAGVTVTLLLLPALTLAGFAAIALRPSLGLIVVFQVARRTTDYFAARPARELCYVVVDRDAKYAAKSFIDTFVYRGGDGLGAGVFGIAGAVAPIVALPLCIAWLALAMCLGRMQRRLSRA